MEKQTLKELIDNLKYFNKKKFYSSGRLFI